jgi:hypothetical protein
VATFGQTVTSIARRLIDDNNTAVTLVEIRSAVNEAVSTHKHKRFWFNTATADLSIAVGDTAVTLPDDFLIDIPRNAFTITQDSFRYPVNKVKPTDYDNSLNTAATGRPQIYCYRDGTLAFAPYPDRAYSGKLYYLKDYADFPTDDTADDTTNDFLTEAPSLIMYEALMNLSGDIRNDDAREDRYTIKVAKEYSKLLSRTNALLKTGTLSIET